MPAGEQIDQFHEQGYLILERLIDGEKLNCYMSIFDELVNRSKSVPIGTPHWKFEIDADRQQNPELLHKIQGVCIVESRVLEIASTPMILDIVEKLTGTDIDVFGTKFFPKLPHGGTSVMWHQDNFYFGITSDQIVSCAIYFDDTDRENGCLRVIPQSHLYKEIATHNKNPYGYGHLTQPDESQAIDVAVPAGTVVLFSANLLHGTYENRSERSRYSTAWHYIPGGLPLERFPRAGHSDRHSVRGK
ncbi:hypothetical protein CMK22_06515 [Candidatus Poribacteria bacterium]|nr:hypothetical protein [Candidatus Poribacteria bacterium]